MLGGVFNALIAPVIFSSLLEYRLALVLAGLAMPPWRHCWPWLMSRRREMAATGLLILLAALLWWQGPSPFWQYGVPLLACGLVLTRPWVFGLSIGTIYFLALSFALSKGFQEFYRGRSFFGTLYVVGDEGGQCRLLYHGQTLHGAQLLDSTYRRLPLGYYDPTGPIGAVFAGLRAGVSEKSVERVAIIGLGSGTLAAYGRPGQEFTFFEIDPAVEQVARTQFTYLSDCRASCKVVLGDARLSLMQEPAEHYGLIVLDAFNSDSIPTHLLTREAFSLYRDKLAEHGILAVHISNKYLDLEPVVFEVARADDLVIRSWLDTTMSPAALARGKRISRWAILARQEADFRGLQHDLRWRPFCRKKIGVWTDDYSNVVSILDFASP
jgi:hypothetical protein